jgi:hypothetical protein
MPAARAKLSAAQARALVAYVRAFAPAPRKAGRGQQGWADAAGFDEQFRRLREKMDRLDGQLRKLSEGSPGGVPPEPSNSRRQKVPRPPAPAAKAPAALPQNADAAAAASELPPAPPADDAGAWGSRIPGAVFYGGFPPG